MAQGYKDFTAGSILTAADLEDYCQNQSILRFATAAARNAAVAGILTEGLMTYQIDTNTITVYSGAAWSTVGPVHGGLTTWVPAVVQSGAVAVTVSRAVYQRIGRCVEGDVELLVTGTGVANNQVTITTPVTAAYAGSGTHAAGVGHVFDNSASLYYPAILVMRTTATFAMLASSVETAVYLGQTGAPFPAALANPDRISFSFRYEAAADA